MGHTHFLPDCLFGRIYVGLTTSKENGGEGHHFADLHAFTAAVEKLIKSSVNEPIETVLVSSHLDNCWLYQEVGGPVLSHSCPYRGAGGHVSQSG